MGFPFSLGDLFPLAGSKRAANLAKAACTKGRRNKRRSAFTVEALEPRILLSADSLVAGSASALLNGLGALGDELEQVIYDDDTNVTEPFDAYVPGVLATFGSGDEKFLASPTLRQALGIAVDTTGPSNLNNVSTLLLNTLISSNPSLAQRYEFVKTTVPAQSGFESPEALDELALRAMDLDGDQQVTLEEAFQVMVVGQLKGYLDSALPGTGAEGLGDALETFFDTTLTVLSYLSDRFGIVVDSVGHSVSDEGTLTVVLNDFKLSMVQRDRLDLGQQADELGLVVDPPSTNLALLPDSIPVPTADPVSVSLLRTLSFDSLRFGLRSTDGGVGNNDFFFGATGSSIHAGVRTIDGFELMKNSGVQTGFTMNVGFLGAYANADIASDGTDFDLYVATRGGTTDPSNPDALGFALGQQGVGNVGSITALGSIDSGTLDTSVIEFSIKLGTHVTGFPVTVALDVRGGSTETQAAALVAPLQTALNDKGLGVLTVSDSAGALKIAVAGHNPAPLGFADQTAVLFTQTGNAIALVGKTAAQLSVNPDASFVLVVTNATSGKTVARLVNVNIAAFSGDGADATNGTSDDVTEIADVRAAVSAALASAFSGTGIGFAVGGAGTNVDISSAGRVLQVSRALTLDTVEQITLAELTGPAKVLDLAKDSASTFQASFVVTALLGLTGDDGDGDVNGSFTPTGTIKIDLDDPFVDVTGHTVDVASDGTPIVKASYALTDGNGTPLGNTTAANDMKRLLDFNVIGPADMLAIVSQLATYLERLAASDLLQAMDLPLVDATLGDLLQFKDFVSDSLLIDDFDDGATKSGPGKDAPRLLQWVGDDLRLGFGTAQEFEIRLAQVFARLQGLSPSFPAWDGAVDAALTLIKGSVVTTPFKGQPSPTLTYNLDFSGSLLPMVDPAVADSDTVAAPLDFDLNLAPLGAFETESKVRIGADGHFTATLGVVLGNNVPVLQNGTPLAELNGENGVTVNTNRAYTGNGLVNAMVGRLTSSATFTVRAFSAPNVFTDHAVTVSKLSTAGNFTLEDLRSNVASALVAAGLPAVKIQVVAEDNDNTQATGRLFLRAVAGAGVYRLQIVAANSSAINQLGFNPQSATTVSVVAPSGFISPDLGGAAGTLDLAIAVNGGAAVNVAVGGFIGNVATNDLVEDFNNAIAQTALNGRIVVSDAGGRLAFSAIDPSIWFFSVDPDNADKALGVAAGLDISAAADPSPAMKAGVALQGSASPIDPFGRLKDNIDFTVTVNGVGAAVSLAQSATSGNQNIADLAKQLTAALPGTVQAVAEGGRIVLRAIDASVKSIAVSGLGDDEVDVIDAATGLVLYKSTYLGLTNASAGDATSGVPLQLATSRSAPVSYGVSTDSTFDISITYGAGPTVTKTIEMFASSSVYNRSLYDLAAQVNGQLSAKFGATNPLVANVQGGRLVIGLKTGNGTGFNVVGNVAPVAADVIGFEVKNVGAFAASDLKLVAGMANHDDLLVYLQDGKVAHVTIPGDASQKATGTIGSVIGLIQNAANALAGRGAGSLVVEPGLDGTSLKVTDKIAGTSLLRIVAVNGSPAALNLGLLGSDTSNLNINEQGVGVAAVRDHVIDGGRIASIDIVDRAFFQNITLTADLRVKTDPDADLSATAAYGLVGVELTKAKNTLLYDADITIPFKAQTFTLDELLRDLGRIDLLQQDFTGLPTATSANTIDFSVKVAPAVLDFVPANAFDLGPGAKVTVDFVGDSLGKLRYVLADGIDPDALPELTDVQPASGVIDLRYQAPAVTLTDASLGNLDLFDKLKFNELVDALQGIANALSAFDALPFLDEKLPVLGISLNDVLDVGKRFQDAVNGLKEDAGATLQALSQKLREAFGLPVFANDAARDAFFANLGILNPTSLITFSLDGGRLWVDLRLPLAFSKALSLDLDLGDIAFLGATLQDLALQGGAGLRTGGYLDVRMKFGVNLSNPADVVVDDALSGVTGKLFAGADNLAFNAAIGPLGVFVKDGSADADLGFTFKGNESSDGSHETLTAFVSQLRAQLQTGSISAALPIYAPTDSEYLDDLTFQLTGIGLDSGGHFTTPAATVHLPNFTAIDLSKVNPFNNIPLMLDGLDVFLQTLQDTLTGQVFSIELPFIGDDLRSAANFIEDLRRDVLGPIRQYVEQAPELGETLVQALLYAVLGPGSEFATVGGIALKTVLGLPADFGGIGLLLDGADAGSGVNQTDVRVTSVDTNGDSKKDDFLWQFQLGDSFTPSYGLSFDLGIPALALQGDLGLDIALSWVLAAGFGVNLDDGAYLDTSSAAELTLNAAVGVSAGSMVEGSLGFLQLEIRNGAVAQAGLEGANTAGLGRTFLEGLVTIDFQDDTATPDNKVSFSDLGNLKVVPAVQFDAEVNLDLIARINPTVVPDTIAALIPELRATFVLDWDYSPTSTDFAGSLNLLGFRHVSLDMGSFFDDFVEPFIGKIAEVTEPLQPIIDVITAPIPVLSDLAGSPVTLVDLAGTFGYVEPAMIYAIADIITLANTLAGATAGGLVDLGDFMLIDDLSSTALMGGAGDKTGLLSGNFFQNDTRFNSADGLAGTLQTKTGTTYNQAYFDSKVDAGSKALIDDAKDSNFDFPILSNPASILGLLVGQDVALVTYDLAPFGMDFSYVQKFPIWGPLFARIGGSVGLSIDLAFGYDTHGIREFADGGFSNPLDLLGGLYVSDTDLPIGTGGTDVPELILKGELLAGAEINLGVGSAGVEGAITLTINFDLFDPDHDGRVRVDELVGNFLYELNYGNPAKAPIAIFDVTGSVTAELRAFVELLFYSQKWTITPPITLAEFSIDFERESFLATERKDGSLLLNIGPNAGQRLNGNTDDGAETIFVKSLSATQVAVWGMGIAESDAQSYKIDASKGIFGYAGLGNDKVDLSQVTHGIVYHLEGGAGDDTLLGSQAGGQLFGDEGNDKLTGGDGGDEIQGGEGADEIKGGKSRDVIFGDTGFVSNYGGKTTYRSFVGANDGGDTIFGDGGEDIAFGGGGIDILHGGDDADLLIGDGGNLQLNGGVNLAGQLPRLGDGRLDVYTRGAGAKDIVLGEAGSDYLLGGSGDDIADGGADNDEIEGGIGFDTLYGGSGADKIYGGDQDDLMFGKRDPFPRLGFEGDSGDAVADGNDILFGEDGNDFMRGQDGVDTMDGGRGADILFGDAGNDVMRGDAGGDILFGGANSDNINAGDGSDIVFGDDGLVLYATFGAVTTDASVGQFGSRIRNDGTARYIGDGDQTALTPTHTLDTIASSIDLIITKPLASDGADFIAGGDGKDIVFGGGSGGAGTFDTIFGDFDPSQPLQGPRPSGQDILIGDGGRIELVGRRNARAAAESNVLDGIDKMYGNDGGDYMFGGGASDEMHGFYPTGTPLPDVSDNDVMLGDNGEILLAEGEVANRIESIRTTYVVADSGRSDTMFGTFGNDVMFGGLNGSMDVIEGGLGQDIALGDQGEIRFDLDGNLDTLDLIRSYRDGLGGIDIVSGGQGADVLIGGTAGDEMYGDNAAASSGADDGEDIMLGDNADVWLVDTLGRLTVKVAAMPVGTAVDLITTTDDSDLYGGADMMSGNAGADIVFGGVNAGGVDTLYGDRASPTATTIALDGDDILVGDDGLLDFDFDGAGDRNTLDLIRSFEDGLGGMDDISGNKGADFAIGGTGGDTIRGDDATASARASDGSDALVGDNADVFLVTTTGPYTTSGADLRTVLGAGVKTIRSTDEENPLYGGRDTISGNAKGDIILGGVFGDLLYGDAALTSATTDARDGNDVMLGDNGALEWLSTGRLSDIEGITIVAHNPALWAKYGGGVAADANLGTLDLVTTEQPNSGGRDEMFGNAFNDVMFGGTDSDLMRGSAGVDVMFGDHGRLYPQFSFVQTASGLVAPNPPFHSRNWFAVDTGALDGGQGDRLYGDAGDDTMLGQQGDDRMWGGDDNDDMIGGHNVAGTGLVDVAIDEFVGAIAALLTTPDNAMNDVMDGGAGDDAMAGDNAIVWRRGDDLSPRFRQLNAATIYTTTPSTITLNVSGALQSDPNDAVGRDILLVDHADGTAAGLFGKDVMAGGADDDTMFGELGDDLMQGDGNIGVDDFNALTITRKIEFTDTPTALPAPFDTDETLYFNVPEAGTDGDDYMEGNGGRDLMYGNLGQDDMIGGSSALFGLATNAMRPDDSDTMFGGAGVRILRNDLGMAAANGTEGTAPSQSTNIVVAASDGNARDADFMMGDNANVLRIVTGAADDAFRTFNYDDAYAGNLRIVPRGMQQLDYELGGADFGGGSYDFATGRASVTGKLEDNGSADLIHGEAGDDIIFGMTGSDVLFGDGQNDDIIGGYGHDWISGGTGQDGVLGDDGLVFTSRNSALGEPLYGVAALKPAATDDTKYSNGDVLDELIATPGSIQSALINVSGELKKTVDLVPFSFDAGWLARDDEFPDNADAKPYADDIIFGGWGSDWLHGGSGDDAVSGAEALLAAYVPVYNAVGDPIGIYDLGYAAVGVANALVVNPTHTNPGNVLAFQPDDVDGAHLNNRFRAGEFRLYDEYNPRQKILLDGLGKATLDGSGAEWLLAFIAQRGPTVPGAIEGVWRPAGNVPKATGQQTESYTAASDDGADAIFGDLGNDWLVGGTGRDNMYGGWGNDYLLADDDLATETVGVAAPNDNESPDTQPTFEDRAYGGAGRDVLIGNTGGDRLIDWVGEYNSYLVPYAPFGQASVSRTLQPFLPEFLYALSAGDGADPTRFRDAFPGNPVPQPTGNNPNPSRNGEPHGELGLVLQKDVAWGDQTGAPADPQAGNIPGGPRDVLRSADFAGNNANGFVAASGTWTVANSAYEVAPSSTSSNKDAISLFNSDVSVPNYFEITATINAIKPVAGFKANAYIIFDYYSPTDFKFAGLDVSTNKIQIGQRASWGFQVLATKNMTLRAGTDYNVLVAINGSAVTLVIDNVNSVSYAFAPRVDADGFTYGINSGMYGLGADNAKARIDNAVVQRIPPKVTLTRTDGFDVGGSSLLSPAGAGWAFQSGRMLGSAVSGAPFALAVNDIAVSGSALLKLDATFSTTGLGGIAFDVYSPTDFKWAAISKTTNQVLVGHYTARGGWVVDQAVTRTLAAGDNTLTLTLRGTTVNVALDGQAVLSRVYNSNVVDGAVGLFSRSGNASFDSFSLQTDDAKFATATALSAPRETSASRLSTASATPVTSTTTSFTSSFTAEVTPASLPAPVVLGRSEFVEDAAKAQLGVAPPVTAPAASGDPLATAPAALGRSTQSFGSPDAGAAATQSAEMDMLVSGGSATSADAAPEIAFDWSATDIGVASVAAVSSKTSAAWLEGFLLNGGRRATDPNARLRITA